MGQTGVVAVTAVPDEKKGEKLMLLYASEAADAETLRRYLSASTRAYLWKPGRACYIEVKNLPILGTGKLDLKGIREIARGVVGG